jgi:hypothetical protein
MVVEKYRKKPIVVEAIQWTGKNLKEVIKFLNDCNCKREVRIEDDDDGHIKLSIVTLEGVMKANYGDYIIKGIKGEFYPCRKDIFEETYENLLPYLSDRVW